MEIIFSEIFDVIKNRNKYMSTIFNPLSYELQFRVISENKYITIYYLDRKYHRSDGPAIIRRNGDLEWYRNGKRHRSNGPAIITKEKEIWYQDGVICRSLIDSLLFRPAYIKLVTGKKYLLVNFEKSHVLFTVANIFIITYTVCSFIKMKALV